MWLEGRGLREDQDKVGISKRGVRGISLNKK